MIGNQVTLTALPGIMVNEVFLFTSDRDKTQARLHIVKEDTVQVLYKLAISYLGAGEFKKEKFEIQINDRNPVFNDGNPVLYHGSRKLTFRPLGQNTLEVEEEDHLDGGKIRIDLSSLPYKACVFVDTSIEALVEKGKNFKPIGWGKEIKNVFYHKDVGVILYAQGEEAEDIDIYFGKDGKFTKCKAKCLNLEKFIQGNSHWNVKIKGQDSWHKLTFPIRSPQGSKSEISWDGVKLEQAL